MNSIEFQIVHEERNNTAIAVVSPVIDGTELRLLVARVEEPFARAEGAPHIAGQYHGLWVRYLSPPSRHLFGEPSHPVYRCGEKTQLLECECGEPGCWRLLCRVTVTSNKVVWSDFEQPHRNGHGNHKAWEYIGFGPFEFERGAYDRAVAALAPGPDS